MQPDGPKPWVMDVNAELRILEEDSEHGYLTYSQQACALSRLDEDCKKEFWAALAFRHCSGLGLKTGGRLLKHYGSAYEAFSRCEEWPQFGIAKGIVNELNSGHWRNNAHAEWEIAHKIDARVLLWTNSLYPDLLREIIDPPPFLYFKGDASLLHSPCIAIVGSRAASSEGLRLAAGFAEKLSRAGITIVSGMAMGIDKHAHEAALNGVGKSIGVLGTGIDIKYPLSNLDLYAKMENSGLLVSGFEPQKGAGPYSFPIRNRIISGVSLGVLVIEAAEKSGSLITARLALEQNREVFAVPARPFSDCSMGCQNLLRNGAHPAFNAENIIEELSEALRIFGSHKSGKNYTLCTKGETGNSKDTSRIKIESTPANIIKQESKEGPEEKVLNLLNQNGPTQFEFLTNCLSMTPEKLNVILTGLEIDGRIKRLPGARYDIT